MWRHVTTGPLEQPERLAQSPGTAIDPGPSSMSLMLPAKYSTRIYRCSFMSIASVASAAFNEQAACLACAMLVMVTSINHWRRPEWKSVRRRMDMLAVGAAAAYQLFMVSPTAPRGACAAYVATVVLGTACYAAARRSRSVHGDLDRSTWWHCGLHLCGNCGNLILYDALGANKLGWPISTRLS